MSIANFFAFGKRSAAGDELFLDRIKNQSDIWNSAMSDPEHNIICCPQNSSLGEDISRDQMMSHVLIPDRKAGEFKTLKGEQVCLIDSEIVCGLGFTETRKLKILSTETASDFFGNTITVFKVSRPLVGGLISPDESDEISVPVMLKYVTVMKTFPEAESSFVQLDEYLKKVNFVGNQSDDGFSKVTPSLKAALHLRWMRTTDRFRRSASLTQCIGSIANSASSKQIMGQIVESYIMHTLYGTVYPWTTRTLQYQRVRLNPLYEYVKECTQADLQIPPEFQTNQTDAILEMQHIATMKTPVCKMMRMKQVVAKVRESIDLNAQRNFPGEDLELSTDDLVLVLIYVIAQAFPLYSTLHEDVIYIQEYHFVSSSRSQLGYTLCHFEVALQWFTDRLPLFEEKTRLQEEKQEEQALSRNGDVNVTDKGNRIQQSRKTLTSDVAKSSQSGEKVDKDDSHEQLESSAAIDLNNQDDLVDIGDEKSIHADESKQDGDPLKLERSITAIPTLPEQMLTTAAESNNEWARIYVASGARTWTDDSVDGGDGYSATNGLKSKSGMDANGAASKERDRLLSFSQMQTPGTPKNTNDQPSNANGSNGKNGTQKDEDIGEGDNVAQSDDAYAVMMQRKKLPLRPAAKVYVLSSDSRKLSSKPLNIPTERTNKAGAIDQIAGSDGFYAAVNEDKCVYTWGRPHSGRLGRGVASELDHFQPILKPQMVLSFPENTKIKQVSCGRYHALAVTEAGQVYAWGDNRCGQLGLTSSSYRYERSRAKLYAEANVKGAPQIQQKLVDFVVTDLLSVSASAPMLLEELKHVNMHSVACGSYHSLALGSDGTVYSWGRATNGRLGRLLYKGSAVPDNAEGRPGVVQCTWRRSSKDDKDRDPNGWAMVDSFRGLGTPKSDTHTTASPKGMSVKYTGNETTSPNPAITSASPRTAVPQSHAQATPTPNASDKPERVVAISCGFAHSVAVTESGSVFTWGCGLFGRLGHGVHCDELVPRCVDALNAPMIHIVTASAGFAHTVFCALEGQLYGCGLDEFGQVGADNGIVEGRSGSSPCDLNSRTENKSKYEKHAILVPQRISIPCQGTPGSSKGERLSVDEYNNFKDVYTPTPLGGIGHGGEDVLCVESLSCGDEVTAVTCRDGSVYVWGRGFDGKTRYDAAIISAQAYMRTVSTDSVLSSPGKQGKERIEKHPIMVACSGNDVVAIL